MGWARRLALVGVLCAGGTARAEPLPGVENITAEKVRVSEETHLRARLPGRLSIESAPRLFDASAFPITSSTVRGRKLLVGYSVRTDKAQLGLRAGYRYGLPLTETTRRASDEGLMLTSGGTLAISAGTVAWLALEVDGYQEVAGERLVRLDAVPGLRFRVGHDSPYDAGIGCLAVLKPLSTEGFGIERFAAVARISGRF